MRIYERLQRLAPGTATTAAGVLFAACALTLAGPNVAFVPSPDRTGALWLPAGAGVALLLLAGRRTWPALLAGALAANVVARHDLGAALALAVAATAEAYVGAHVAAYIAGGRRALDRTSSFVAFVVGAGVVASVTGPALAGILNGLLSSAVQFSRPLLASWWIGDAMNTLVYAPALLLLQGRGGVAPEPERGTAEHVFTAFALVVTWAASFSARLPWGLAHVPFDVICVPPMLWVAYRFGPRAAAMAVSGLALVALQGTLSGVGPFVTLTHRVSMVALEAFVGVTAMTTFALAILAHERRVAEAELERLARTDSLTGLANYGRFIEALEVETARAARTGRDFALLFVDLDGLKRINDTQGHLAGNEAIQRVANALRATCREIDTVARLGGDEFCALLPGADTVTAWFVSRRVARQLRAPEGATPVTVSIGIAAYPRDGATPEALLAAADSLLYGEKSRRRSSGPVFVPAET